MERLLRPWLAALAALFLLPLTACGGAGSSSGTSTAPTNPSATYEFWKGAIPNTYYSLNIYGDRAL